MTKEDRIRSLKELNEEKNPKRIKYECNKCGFNILGKVNGFKHIEIKYKDYDIDYLREWYDLRKGERLHCEYATNYICLNCGKPAFSYERLKKCSECNSDNCVHFSKLLDKKCPKCDGRFILAEKYKNELEYKNVLNDKRFEYLLQLILEKELDINTVIKRETNSYQHDLYYRYFEYFNDDNFVINQQKNIIKMTWNSCWLDIMLIIIEWEDISNAKVIYCYPKFYDDKFEGIEVGNINKIDLEKILEILINKGFFNNYNEEERFGLDGYTLELECKYGELYNYAEVWAPCKGLILDTCNLIMEICNKEYPKFFV
jgi:DNA-directed RNA polymerase subunit RPC12/RpoP